MGFFRLFNIHLLCKRSITTMQNFISSPHEVRCISSTEGCIPFAMMICTFFKIDDIQGIRLDFSLWFNTSNRDIYAVQNGLNVVFFVLEKPCFCKAFILWFVLCGWGVYYCQYQNVAFYTIDDCNNLYLGICHRIV